MNMEIFESRKKKLRIQIRIPIIFAKTEKKKKGIVEPNPSGCSTDIFKEIKFAMFRRSSL